MTRPAPWLAAIVLVLLASCSTAPTVPTARTSPASSTSPPAKGGYYQDDGPPERTPADLAATPDAVPRIEPIHPRANRPYTALGRSYTPLATDVSFRQRGLASWYGKQFHGNRTASGEIYNMLAMTAAHPTLPIPSYVRVTAVRSGRSVIVRVNDRGPFKDDRIIDLSYAAATKLGYAGAGTAEVEVERITTAQIANGEWQGAAGVAAAASAVAAKSNFVLAPIPAVDSPSSLVAGRWAVQLGAFAQESNADSFAQRISALLSFVDAADWPPAQRTPRVEREQGTYRVLIGALADKAAAVALAGELERLLQRPTTVLAR